MASRTEKYLQSKIVSPVIKREMKKLTQAVEKKNNQGAKTTEKEIELQPYGSSILSPTDYYNDLNYSTYDLLERFFGFVYAPIKAIADDMATIELKLMQVTQDGIQEVENHPVLELLGGVNKDMTFGDIVSQYVIHKKLAGNAYWYLVRNGNTIEQIRVLRPDWVKVIPGDYRKGSAVAGYEVAVSGRAPQRVPAEDIIHFREPSAVSSTYGMGVLEASLRTANLEYNAEEWNNAFFKNAASTGGVFIFNGVLGKENRERLVENIKQQYSGLRNAYKSIVIDGGGDYKEAGRTQRDMEFTQMQEWVRDKLLAMFRVSKSILGMSNDFNKANIDGSEYIFAKRVMKPEFMAFTDKLNEFLLPQFPGTEGMFLDFEDPVPQDDEKLVTKIQALSPTYITPNEAREMLDLDPIGEEGDFLYIPTSVQRIDKAGAAPVAPQQNPNDPTQPNDMPMNDPVQNEAGYVKVKGNPVKPKMSSYAKKYVSKIRNNKKYKRTLEIQEKLADMKEKIEKALGDIKNPSNEMNMRIFQKAMDDEAKGYVSQLIGVMHRAFENDQIQILRSLRKHKEFMKTKGLADVINYLNDSRYLKQLIETDATDIIIRANAKQGKRAASFISTKPYKQTKAIKKKLADNTKKMGTSVMETRRDAIVRQLEEGILKQESIAKISKRLEEYYTNYENNKATQVATTEVFRAFNTANVEAWKQDDNVTAKQWFTGADERTCEFCAPQHGKILELSSSFYDKGYELEGSKGGILNLDYEDVASPPLHPNCRCTLAPIIGGTKIADPTFGGVPINSKEADFLTENDIKYVEGKKQDNGVIAKYNRKDNTMYVYDKESVDFKHTLYHELGHAIDREKETTFLSSGIAADAINSDRNNVIIYRTIQENGISYDEAKAAFDEATKSGIPSKYINRIKTSPEVFADGYAQFKQNPAQFKAYAPKLYKIFKELF